MSSLAANLVRVVLVGLCVLVVLVGLATIEAMGWKAAFVSGWLLGLVVLLLSVYRINRRLSVLPMGDVATWTALHLFLGWLAVGLFVVHTGAAWPGGVLESALAALFVLALVSGLFGQWLNHQMPRRLTSLGEELLYERLPVFRRQLSDNADNILALAVEARRDSPLASYYVERLRPWFAGLRLAPFGTSTARRRWIRLERDLDDLARYLSADETALVAELRALMRKKHELDLSYSYQWLLRAWLLVHVPAAFGSVVLMIVHVAASHAFAGL